MLSSNLLQGASVSVSCNFLHLLSILYGAMGEMTPRALFLLGDGLTGVLLSPPVCLFQVLWLNPRLHQATGFPKL